MATRIVYMSSLSGHPCVHRQKVDFVWHPGLSVSQKQKSIDSLHENAKKVIGNCRILEISSKSREEIGRELSAFKLSFMTKRTNRRIIVECAFQSSKVFSRGGPYLELMEVSPKEAKRSELLKSSGELTEFNYFGRRWELEPKTAFYDWLYINALEQNEELTKNILSYDAFTDIEFNPEKSVNCQAYSAALFVSLSKQGKLKHVMSSKENYLEFIANDRSSRNNQLNLLR